MSRDVNLLHPRIKQLCKDFVINCHNSGLEVIITQTLRTKSDQDALYAQGRTRPGNIVTRAKYPQSPHCWGVAFDFAVKVNGQVTWAHPELYRKAGQIAKALGLVWGGDFKSFVDTPHVEDPVYVVDKSVNTLKAKWGTPAKFIVSWQNESEDEDMLTPIKVIIDGTAQDGYMKDGKVLVELRPYTTAIFPTAKITPDIANRKVMVNTHA